ncbi:MAG: PKD domain-containing protein, partial [Caldilineaceae bacterium]
SFVGNEAQSAGAIDAGAALDSTVELPTVFIANSLFHANLRGAASAPSDLLLVDRSARLINNTHAGSVGPAPSVASFSSALTVTNSIFATYGDQAIYAGNNFPGPTLQDFNLFFDAQPGQNVTNGPNSLTADPLFVDAGAGNFALQLLSPAVDRGSDAAALAAGLQSDLPGGPRLVNGSAARPATVDMGAYEMPLLAPTAVAGGPYAASEGTPMALNGSGSTGAPPLTFRWDCRNDGATIIESNAPTGATCTYADNGSATLGLRVTATTGLTSTATAAVTVQNVAPAVSAPPNQQAVAGTVQSFALGSFSDPGVLDAPWQVTINWGDGTPNTILTRTSQGAIPTQSHAYASAGAKTVTVQVRDKDNATGSATAVVTVAPVPPPPPPPPPPSAGGSHLPLIFGAP